MTYFLFLTQNEDLYSSQSGEISIITAATEKETLLQNLPIEFKDHSLLKRF